MGDTVVLVDKDGKPAIGATFNAQAGIQLGVRLPAGRRLRTARLQLGCADSTELPVEYPPLQTDTGPMGNRPEASWLWASQDWGEERVLVGLTLDASPAANPLPRRSGGRVRLHSRGIWQPLPALDTLPTGPEQRFAPVTASRLQLETLIEGVVNDKLTGVLVPGPLNGRRIGLRFTRQPCHPSVAIGEDPPFFNPGGPLPVSGLDVAGLDRALNRYLADNPGSTQIPLRLQTANNQAVRILGFSAELVPLPAVTPPTPSTTRPDLGKPRAQERPWFAEQALQTQRARWCDAQHQAALQLSALPAGCRLSSLALLLRVAEDSAPALTLGLYPDEGGKPGQDALLTWTHTLDTTNEGPAWSLGCLPDPWAGHGTGFWLVCQTGSPGVFWYSAQGRPDSVTGAAFRRTQGAWLPLPGNDEWLQVRMGILDPL